MRDLMRRSVAAPAQAMGPDAAGYPARFAEQPHAVSLKLDDALLAGVYARYRTLEPRWNQDTSKCPYRVIPPSRNLLRDINQLSMVEPDGIEPTTSSMPLKRSPN